MLLLCDTRQKKNYHNNIEKYCIDNNITMVQKCLPVGDYMLLEGNIAVDSKQDLSELASDLYRDKLAFNKKYKKGFSTNMKLIVLVEEPIKNRAELIKWKSKHTKINGRLLLEMMRTLELSYGVKFVFCDKRQTGEILIKLLKGELL